ncbi:PKD domain-containing protein [Myxococcota bacterium]
MPRVVFLIIFLVGGAPAALAQGWAVFANGGKVYRSQVGGNPEQLYSGSAAHACWSADGMYVYFIKSSGEIWRMYNDGSGPSKIANGTSTNYCPIGPYRPDPEQVLYVEGARFYRVNSSGQKTEIHSEPRNYVGEAAITSNGNRMAARGSNSNLYSITVGGSSSQYSDACSSSISPNGSLLTANVGGHVELTIHNWDGSVNKVLDAPAGNEWDNQKFAVNSNDYVVFKYDNMSAIGIVRVSNNQNTRICNMGSDYPDFFVGSLPDPPQGNTPPSASIDSPNNGANYSPGDAINYSGSASDPEDGALTGNSLSWDLDLVGDGQGPVHTSSGASGSYSFPAGISVDTEYTLSLRAEDSGGLADSAQITVWVRPSATNSPPIISAVSARPNPVNVGVEVTFECSAGDPDNDPLTYSWQFGDGGNGSGATATHSYSSSGNYNATVSVDDGQGHTVEDTISVTVVDPDICVIEAEDMSLSGYEIEGDYIATYSTGSGEKPFPCPTDTYRTKVVIIKEDDGQPTLEVHIGGQLIDTIQYPLGAAARDPEAVDLGVIPITNGAEVRLVGTLNDGAAARVDKLTFEKEQIPEEDGGGGDDAGAGGDDAGTQPGDDAGTPPGDDAGMGDDTKPGTDNDDVIGGGCGCSTGRLPHGLIFLLILLMPLLREPRKAPHTPA